MAIPNPVKEQLKKVRKEQRVLKKLEAELQADLKMELNIEKDIGRWKRIADARNACKKIIRDANIGSNMTLTKLENSPNLPSHIYQHPTQRDLKTSDRQQDWVKRFIGELPMGPHGGAGGSLEDLIATARKTRLSAWKRARKKKTIRTRTISNLSKAGKFKRTPEEAVVAAKKGGFFSGR